MEKKSVKMNQAKETKGTFVYEAQVKTGAIITTVYISKSAFVGGTAPLELTLTIE